ncbi:response regulator transcription factor [Telmatospirillum siberiense]|uniref:DNA-binding response regulator n=1 Tax=Telmatospirillum siberiense TaxID=382514 RepID=A0A2N3Q1S8_9PROT|nr:response regulator transcription factor [Telmatospirillum siberiense]PKU26606.1 DNA-binding response regulator [Telmatospirillum siberiense]
MRILFADDHRLLRDGIRSFLSQLNQEAEIIEAESFDDALLVTEGAGGVELALLAQAMPGLNGSAGIQLFTARFPLAKVVLLTTVADPALMWAAIDAGAKAVIFKTISGQNMVSALRLVLLGELYLPADTLKAMAAQVVVGPVMWGNAVDAAFIAQVKFSPAEVDVVPLLLDGLSNKAISDRLGIEETAVKARMRGVYKKIGATNRAQAVWLLLANGVHRSD